MLVYKNVQKAQFKKKYYKATNKGSFSFMCLQNLASLGSDIYVFFYFCFDSKYFRKQSDHQDWVIKIQSWAKIQQSQAFWANFFVNILWSCDTNRNWIIYNVWSLSKYSNMHTKLLPGPSCKAQNTSKYFLDKHIYLILNTRFCMLIFFYFSISEILNFLTC